MMIVSLHVQYAATGFQISRTDREEEKEDLPLSLPRAAEKSRVKLQRGQTEQTRRLRL